MLQMSMGNRLLLPSAPDGCRAATLDTAVTASSKPGSGQSSEPETPGLPARNSFEIMSQFNWDVVDGALCSLTRSLQLRFGFNSISI